MRSPHAALEHSQQNAKELNLCLARYLQTGANGDILALLNLHKKHSVYSNSRHMHLESW